MRINRRAAVVVIILLAVAYLASKAIRVARHSKPRPSHSRGAVEFPPRFDAD